MKELPWHTVSAVFVMRKTLQRCLPRRGRQLGFRLPTASLKLKSCLERLVLLASFTSNRWFTSCPLEMALSHAAMSPTRAAAARSTVDKQTESDRNGIRERWQQKWKLRNRSNRQHMDKAEDEKTLIGVKNEEQWIEETGLLNAEWIVILECEARKMGLNTLAYKHMWSQRNLIVEKV